MSRTEKAARRRDRVDALVVATVTSGKAGKPDGIVELLRGRGVAVTPGEVAAALRRLEAEGLVTTVKGQWRAMCYAVAPGQVKALVEALSVQPQPQRAADRRALRHKMTVMRGYLIGLKGRGSIVDR